MNFFVVAVIECPAPVPCYIFYLLWLVQRKAIEQFILLIFFFSNSVLAHFLGFSQYTSYSVYTQRFCSLSNGPYFPAVGRHFQDNGDDCEDAWLDSGVRGVGTEHRAGSCAGLRNQVVHFGGAVAVAPQSSQRLSSHRGQECLHSHTLCKTVENLENKRKRTKQPFLETAMVIVHISFLFKKPKVKLTMLKHQQMKSF